MRIRISSAFAIAAFLTVSLSSSLVGQAGVRYTSQGMAQFGGTLGSLFNMFAPDEPQETTTFVQGVHMRTDDGSISTILNGETGSVTSLNHEDRTYFTFTFDEMLAGLGSMNMNQAGMEEAQGAEGEAPEVTIEPKIDIDPTGEERRVAGYDARRVLMTIELEAQPTEDAAPEDSVFSGSMVIFTELWLSRDFPAYEAMQEMGEEAKEYWADRVGAQDMGMLGALMERDERLGDALELSQEEVQAMEGMAVKNTTLFYIVGDGQEFDRELAIQALELDLDSDEMGDLLGQAAGESARNALGGLTRGLFGGGRREEPEEPEVDPNPAPLMKMITEITGGERMNVPADMFEVPEGYELVNPPGLVGVGGGR